MGAEPAARAVRLFNLWDLLAASPLGLTTNELAQSLGVGQRSIERDVLTLQTDCGKPLVRDGHRWRVFKRSEL